MADISFEQIVDALAGLDEDQRLQLLTFMTDFTVHTVQRKVSLRKTVHTAGVSAIFATLADVHLTT